MKGESMILEGAYMVFGGGVLGSVLIELTKFGRAASAGVIEERYRKAAFWFGAISLAIVSGFVAVINGTEHVSLSKAIQYGMNAPAIISGLATAQRAARPKKVVSVGIAPNRDNTTQSKPSRMRDWFLLQSW